MPKKKAISHIISGCKMLAANKYTFRHNQVATYIRWNILNDNGIDVLDNWLLYKPKESTIKDKITATWDMSIITGKRINCNKIDILVHNSRTNECQMIDISITNNNNIVSKTVKKQQSIRSLKLNSRNFDTFGK